MNPYINTLRTPLSSTTHPPQPSSKQWRCPHQRLHLDGQDCVPVSPDSPIVDTPSKYRKMQARRNGAAGLGLGSSQGTATQPTPSGPQHQVGKLQENSPEEGSLGSAAHSLQNNREENQYVEHDDSQNFLIPSSPPSQHASHSSRVPETPMADLPSSPPLPLLTVANLRQLNSQPSHSGASRAGAGAPSSSSHNNYLNASLPAPPPSVLSLPSEVAHRISRLVLRTQINAAKLEASEVQLQATRGALEMALARVQLEASRVDAWMGTAVALLLLCLAYAVWCRYNSAEFELIEECRRKWFGL